MEGIARLLMDIEEMDQNPVACFGKVAGQEFNVSGIRKRALTNGSCSHPCGCKSSWRPSRLYEYPQDASRSSTLSSLGSPPPK
jgi:hypothetical protein